MIIALINWRIVPSMNEAFLCKWKTEFILEESHGLIGEFLSKVEDVNFFEKITW